MKRLKVDQPRSCHYCRKQGFKRPAVWRECGMFACDEHKEIMAEANHDDGHRSEADYQTWMRL